MGNAKRHLKTNVYNNFQNQLDKKSPLSQRWPRDAPYIWTPWKISGVPGYAHGYFSRNC